MGTTKIAKKYDPELFANFEYFVVYNSRPGKVPATKVPVECKAKNKSREGWQFRHVRKSRANPGVQPIRQLTDQRFLSWALPGSKNILCSEIIPAVAANPKRWHFIVRNNMDSSILLD